MSDTYIVTAKTIDEAIAKANKLYADDEHEISYDILEMPKKGFLGIGAKDAMLKVTVNEVKDVDLGSIVSDLKSMKIHTDRDGKQNDEAKTENKQANPRNQQNQKPADKKPEANKPQQKQNRQNGEQREAKKPQQNQQKQNQPKNEAKSQPKSEKTEEVLPKNHAEVIVSEPVGLFDLPEKAPSNEWGKAADTKKEAAPEVFEAEEELSGAESAKDALKVAVSEEEMQFALEFANTLLRNMQIDARAERGVCPEGETFETTEDATVYPRIEIVGDGSGILIGHHGETLDAIQYLVNLSAVRKSRKANGHGDYVKIVVDVENYRSKREETLRTLARRMAARAVKNKRNVFLEPMNAYERRIIHSELQNFENVSTHSVGTDKNRKIIITYEGPDKQPSNSRRKPQKAKAEGQKGEKQERSTPKPAAKPSGDRPRPKKPQKMPIEQLPDFLAANSTEPDEVLSIED
ncbi:MAG: KH domain-containing protein [Ruminococcaceae bacterium]|nr:KH domain-containing protein [Oscillospiraceae bacterium]